MEGSATTVSSAITDMATSIATDGVTMLTSVIPVMAPLVGAVILATLGYKFVKKFKN